MFVYKIDELDLSGWARVPVATNMKVRILWKKI